MQQDYLPTLKYYTKKEGIRPYMLSRCKKEGELVLKGKKTYCTCTSGRQKSQCHANQEGKINLEQIYKANHDHCTITPRHQSRTSSHNATAPSPISS